MITNNDIETALWQSNGVISKASALTGLTRRTIYTRLNKEPELQTVLDEVRRQRRAIDKEYKIYVANKAVKLLLSRINDNIISDAGLLGFIKLLSNDIKQELNFDAPGAPDNGEKKELTVHFIDIPDKPETAEEYV